MQIIYHVALMGNWKNVVDQQFDLLNKTGLSSESLTIVAVGQDQRSLALLAKKKGIKPRDIITNQSLEIYESLALRVAQIHAITHPNDVILYFHTKGVSDPENQNKIRHRRLMEWQLLFPWRTHRDDLIADKYDVVGTCYWEEPSHFVGNFWMARSSWLAKLPPLSFTSRLSCEYWIGTIPSMRPKYMVKNHKMWEEDYDWGQWELK